MASRRNAVPVLVASALILAACGGDGGSEGGSAPADPIIDGTLVTAVAGDPGNLDPHMTVLALTRYVGSYLYDQLIFIDEEGQPQPWLAASWQEDAGSVTFTLREGITCSDGAPLTASDVAANFSFVADPANQSPLLGVWVQPGLTAAADDAARTVTLTAAGGPDPFLLQGAGLLPIVCAAGMSDRDSLARDGNGTGMFVITEAVPDDHYSFERRDDYAWGPDGAAASDPGTPKAVTIRVVPNESTAANLFLAGDLHLLSVAGPDQDRLDAQDFPRQETRALFGEVIFNQADGHPGADPAVRQALIQAVDWNEVGAVMTGGKGQAPTGLGVLEPKVCTADTVSGNVPAHDPAAAGQALDAAGWVVEDGVRSRDGDPLALTLMYGSEAGSQYAAAAELASQRWQELGVDVELRAVTSVQVNEVLFGTGAWDAVMLSLNVAFPSQLLPFFTGPPPPDGTNFGAIDNQRYATLTAEAMQQPGAAGCADWQDAEQALIEVADVTPVVDNLVPFYLNGVEVRMSAGSPSPPTLRLFHR